MYNSPSESPYANHEFFDELTFITYFTVYPEPEHVVDYLNEFSDMLLLKDNTKLMVLGPRLAGIAPDELPQKVSTFNSIEQLVKEF